MFHAINPIFQQRIPVPRFQGASPTLTTRYFVPLLPGENEDVVEQVQQALPFQRVLFRRLPGFHIFAQDVQWFFQDIAERLRIKCFPDEAAARGFSAQESLESMTSKASGGNTYIGLHDSGEPYCLVGERVLSKTHSQPEEARQRVASDLDLKNPARVIAIPQYPSWDQYDIDTFIRPLKGNKLLVYDPEESNSFLGDSGLKNLSAATGPDESSRASYRNIHKLLEQAGFQVIKAPGLFFYQGRMCTGESCGFNISLLNALVYENPDTGKMTYLTMDPAKPDLKAAFEKWLKKTCPEIEDVVYIDGGGPVNPFKPYPNRMIQLFNEKKGGLHCMFAEMIDEQRWQAANKVDSDQFSELATTRSI